MPPPGTCRRLLLIAAAVLTVAGWSGSLVRADEPSSNAEAPASADQLQRWLIELSSGNFAARRNAASSLVAQGRGAIDAVAEAARSGDRETTLRCIDVLERIQASDDDAAREEAAAALSQLAQSDDAALAEQARGLVEEPADFEEIQGATPGFRGMPVQIQVMQLAPIQFDDKGERRTEVQEGDRRIEIVESRSGRIVVRTTRPGVNGEKTTEVEAANAAELKANDAEAYLLYRKHLLLGGGAVMLNALPLAPGAANQQVVVTNINGARKVRVVEEDVQVEIQDRDGRDIRIKVTREANGQPISTDYEADDLEELKANHPEAAELYEKYGKGAPAFPIPAVLNVPPGPGPRAAIGQGVPAANPASTANTRIDEALDTLAEVREQVQQLKAHENADTEALEKLVQKLDQAEQRLFEAQSQLED